jgi:tetratricopeptide (TPR) repeat protein
VAAIISRCHRSGRQSPVHWDKPRGAAQVEHFWSMANPLPVTAAPPPLLKTGVCCASNRTNAWRVNLWKISGQRLIRYQLPRHGRRLLASGNKERPREAVGFFRVAVAIRPTNAEAYVMLARALRDCQDTDGAIAAFRQVLALDPNFAAARDLIVALIQRGSWRKPAPPGRNSWSGSRRTMNPGTATPNFAKNGSSAGGFSKTASRAS